MLNKLEEGSPQAKQVADWHKELTETRAWVAEAEDIGVKMLNRIAAIDRGLGTIG